MSRDWRGALAKWSGRLCVYNLPGCTCTRSPEYMAFFRTLTTPTDTEEPQR